MKGDYVVIRLPFKRDDIKAISVFQSVFGQLSDGIWENSNRIIGYWKFIGISSDHDNNYLTLIIDNVSGDFFCKSYITNPYMRMTEAKVIDYFIKKIRQVAKVDLDRFTEGCFNADNMEISKLFSCMVAYNSKQYDVEVTVADVYNMRKELIKYKTRCQDNVKIS